jgi:hypothetical protein
MVQVVVPVCYPKGFLSSSSHSSFSVSSAYLFTFYESAAASWVDYILLVTAGSPTYALPLTNFLILAFGSDSQSQGSRFIPQFFT